MVFDISERQMQYGLFFKKIVQMIFSLLGNIDVLVGFVSLIFNTMVGSTRKSKTSLNFKTTVKRISSVCVLNDENNSNRI